MRILYLEDEPAAARLLVRYFQLTPHQVVFACNLTEAYGMLEPPPDLILVDVPLEGTQDGCKVVERLRSHGYHSPIIAVTALTAPADLVQFRQVGFDAILPRPYELYQVVALIHKYTMPSEPAQMVSLLSRDS